MGRKRKAPGNGMISAGKDGALGAAVGCANVLVAVGFFGQLVGWRSVWTLWSTLLLLSPLLVVLGFFLGTSGRAATERVDRDNAVK